MSTKKHWRAIGGLIAILGALWHFAGALLGLGGDADSIIQHRQNPGWVGGVIHLGERAVAVLLDPPAWSVFPLFIIGFLLVWMDHRKSLSRNLRYKRIREHHPFAKKKILVWGKVKRDRSFAQCLGYVLFSNWESRNENEINSSVAFADVNDAQFTIRQAAIDGTIRLWGMQRGLWSSISPDFFENNEITIEIAKDLQITALPYSELSGSAKQFESIDWEAIRLRAPVLTFGDLWKARTRKSAG
jgi:hypothetical protein